ncbi:sulfatase [Marinoscillum sp.]|uniref:sulfatase n=1 Tax=Marinoscillum sp. TaxID=2024838 RepID=UPI003BAA5981
MKLDSIILALLALLFLLPVTSFSQSDEKYNVLFIGIDDLNNYVTLLNNYPGIKTPNLDRLAKRSVTFTKAYCPAPVCNPSRIAVLTGKSPANTGLYQLLDAFQSSREAVNSTLLPELFKNNDYTTMWSGKIFHTGGDHARTRPDKERLEAMWDDMRGCDGGYGPMPTVDNLTDTAKKPGWFNYQVWQGPDTDFPDVINCNYSIERLERNYQSPFFMALGLYRPHNPWTVPERFFGLYPEDEIVLPKVDENDLDDLSELGKEWAHHPVQLNLLKDSGKWKDFVRAYLAAISFMDFNIGRVLDALEKSDHYENTIVVLWSDNGFHMGEKHHLAKQALWEQTSQVLLMLSVPGMTENGGMRNQPVNLLDIYPTLVELCGLEKPKQTLDGESLVSMTQDPQFKREEPSITYYKHGSISVRTTDYRYIRYYDGTEELYDEVNDPLELKNLAYEEPYQEVIDAISRWIPSKVAPTVTKIGAGK